MHVVSFVAVDIKKKNMVALCEQTVSSVVFIDCLQACRVISGPEPEANAMEAGSFPGPGEGG